MQPEVDGELEPPPAGRRRRAHRTAGQRRVEPEASLPCGERPAGREGLPDAVPGGLAHPPTGPAAALEPEPRAVLVAAADQARPPPGVEAGHQGRTGAVRVGGVEARAEEVVVGAVEGLEGDHPRAELRAGGVPVGTRGGREPVEAAALPARVVVPEQRLLLLALAEVE